jgi:hypothetical protein
MSLVAAEAELRHVRHTELWRSFRLRFTSQNALERDDFFSNRHPAPGYGWSMIFSENRYTPRIKCGAGFFGIML